MFIRGVVDDQVHNQLHAQSVNIGNELVEVFHGSENRINILVITDVVTVISLWRSIDRRKPQDINSRSGTNELGVLLFRSGVEV